MGAETTAGRAIFISYRRADAEGEAGRLYDDLVRAYGDDSVFMDVAGIKPGADFRAVINDNVAGSGVLLAVIGPQWSTVTDATGARRLDDPNDFVRLEIGSALTRNIAVIPVLVRDAHMPRAAVLPDDLKELSYRNSVELTHARWTSDVGLLINALKSYVNVRKDEQAETVHATVPVQLPPPVAAPKRELPRASKSPMMAGIAALVLLGLGGAIYLALHRSGSQDRRSSKSEKDIPLETASAVRVGTPPVEVPTPQAAAVASKTKTPGTAVAANTASQLPVPGDRGYAPMLGTWQSEDAQTGANALVRFQVAKSGSGLAVHAWGLCPECSWGTKPASYIQGALVTESFEPRTTPEEIRKKRGVTLEMHDSAYGLVVTVTNTWHQPDGSVAESKRAETFVRASAQNLPKD